MSGLKIFFKTGVKACRCQLSSMSKHVAPTLLRNDSQQTETMRREIQNPELPRFSTEQSTLEFARIQFQNFRGGICETIYYI
jgi:hypothetical protein